MEDRTVAGQFAISPTGGLAWLAGKVVPYPGNARLVTVDRRGNVTPLPSEPRDYTTGVRVSPDGRSLAVGIIGLDESSVWTVDLARGTLTPVARGSEADTPVWTPDGQRLIYSWLDAGRAALAVQRADGTGAREVLALEGGEEVAAEMRLTRTRYPGSWLPDGRQLLLVGNGVEIASLEGRRAVLQQLKVAEATVFCPEFSPNGQWLVHSSAETGRPEVYVESYPGLGRRTQVSIGGARCCAWSKNGLEIFLVSDPSTPGVQDSMMVAEFEPQTGRVGTPKRLFAIAPDLAFTSYLHTFDISSDGQQFYVRQSFPAPPLPPVTHINVITNWFEELKAKVPSQ